jgi:hypothetical protein
MWCVVRLTRARGLTCGDKLGPVPVTKNTLRGEARDIAASGSGNQ